MTAELDLEEGPPVFEGSVSRPFQLVGAGAHKAFDWDPTPRRLLSGRGLTN